MFLKFTTAAAATKDKHFTKKEDTLYVSLARVGNVFLNKACALICVTGVGGKPLIEVLFLNVKYFFSKDYQISLFQLTAI